MRQIRVVAAVLSLVLAISAAAQHIARPVASASVEAQGGLYVSVTPARLLNAGTWAGGTGNFASGETKTVPVAGRAGIPTGGGVAAVVVDITAHGTSESASNYLTAWPSGTTRPVAASLYFDKENVPRTNTVVAKLGSDGAINVFNYTGITSVTVDVQGYFTDAPDGSGGFVALNPVRIASTTGGAAGANIPQARLAVGAHLDIQAAGVSTIGNDATSAYVNVEARNASAPGTLWIGPGGSTQTWPQSMEYGDNGPYNSGRAVKLDAQGKLRIKNLTGTAIDLKIDVQGYFSGVPGEGSDFTPLSPANVFSSGLSGSELLAGGETRSVYVAEEGGLPAAGSMGAAVLTMSVKNWTASGTVTPFEAGVADPGTTVVSFVAGQGEPANGISSTAIVRVSQDGAIDIRNTSTQPVAFTITTQGWFAPNATQLSEWALQPPEALSEVRTFEVEPQELATAAESGPLLFAVPQLAGESLNAGLDSLIKLMDPDGSALGTYEIGIMDANGQPVDFAIGVQEAAFSVTPDVNESTAYPLTVVPSFNPAPFVAEEAPEVNTWVGLKDPAVRYNAGCRSKSFKQKYGLGYTYYGLNFAVRWCWSAGSPQTARNKKITGSTSAWANFNNQVSNDIGPTNVDRIPISSGWVDSNGSTNVYFWFQSRGCLAGDAIGILCSKWTWHRIKMRLYAGGSHAILARS